MKTLRIELPRLPELRAETLVHWTVVDGIEIIRSGELPLNGLAAVLPTMSIAAILHPADATLARTTLPPLPAHRMREAIPAAAEPLTLSDPDTLAIAGSPRNSDGLATLAWTERQTLTDAWSLLADHGLFVEQFIPAPLALPWSDGASFALRDHYLLARLNLHEGYRLALDPLLSEGEPPEDAIAWLRLILSAPASSTITWIGHCPAWARALLPPDSRFLPDQARWIGPFPGWSLALSALRPRQMQRSPWRRPLAWSALAVALWLAGLNLYAAQLRGEESLLRQQMVEKVKTAFPQLPVVLDPIRQATQQRDALLGALGHAAQSDMLPLLQAATELLPASANNVQSLEYADGELALALIDNTATPEGALDPTLAARAHELGLQVDFQEGRWLIQRQNGGPSDNTTAAGFTISNLPGATGSGLRPRNPS